MKFLEILNLAIEDLMEHGFDSKERLDKWLYQLNRAARHMLVPEARMAVAVRSGLERAFKAATNPNKLMRVHKGVSAYTLQQIKPKLRAELDRRIMASADLITLNRDASISRTLQRFAGWATSIPKGGSDVRTRAETKKLIKKGIASLPFEERRVIIDQGHKLVASINEIVAVEGGAIAAVWRHIHEGPPACAARPEHVARDGKIFLYRNSWARARGLVKPSSVGYTDDVTQPAEEPFCRCHWEFIYALRGLPESMLTSKGKEALLESREKLKALLA
jgi:hypothetical protein